jgi:hypothetical protein
VRHRPVLGDQQVDLLQAAPALEACADPLHLGQVENAEPLGLVPGVAQ